MLRRRSLLGGNGKRLDNGLYLELLDHRLIPYAIDSNGTIIDNYDYVVSKFIELGIETPYNEINSVVIVTDDYAARIHKTSVFVSSRYMFRRNFYLDYLTPIPGANSNYNSWYSNPSGNYMAYDYYGYERRDKYMEVDSETNSVEYFCYHFKWPDGNRGGYWPGQGEVAEIKRYKSVINSYWGTLFDGSFVSDNESIVTSTPDSNYYWITTNGIKFYRNIRYFKWNSNSIYSVQTGTTSENYYFLVFDKYEPYDCELV